jgi:hypothetical protein
MTYMSALQSKEKMPHAVPSDLRAAIVSVPKVQALWEAITPLARNEWVCWVISGKQEKTRGIRIQKAISKMKSGMRRPCCWMGCPHRTDKPLSPSVKWVLSKQNENLK